MLDVIDIYEFSKVRIVWVYKNHCILKIEVDSYLVTITIQPDLIHSWFSNNNLELFQDLKK